MRKPDRSAGNTPEIAALDEKRRLERTPVFPSVRPEDLLNLVVDVRLLRTRARSTRSSTEAAVTFNDAQTA